MKNDGNPRVRKNGTPAFPLPLPPPITSRASWGLASRKEADVPSPSAVLSCWRGVQSATCLTRLSVGIAAGTMAERQREGYGRSVSHAIDHPNTRPPPPPNSRKRNTNDLTISRGRRVGLPWALRLQGSSPYVPVEGAVSCGNCNLLQQQERVVAFCLRHCCPRKLSSTGSRIFQ